MLALIDRFEKKFIPEPNSGCWLWEAGVDSSGYGNFVYQGRTLGAHKVAYIIYNGDVPKGYLVCHVCDVRCCVNPKHLFIGTHADNMKDRNTKGRQARLRGNKNGNSKLSESNIWEILNKYDGKINTIYSLGIEYGVHPTTIHLILCGRNWAHITKRGIQCSTKEGKCL